MSHTSFLKNSFREKFAATFFVESVKTVGSFK